MKFRFLVAVFTVSTVLFASCGREGIRPSNCREGECVYFFEEGKQLAIDSIAFGTEFVNTEAGPDLVFTYEYEKDEDPRIADAGYTEWIRLQLPNDVISFSFKGEQLKDLPLYLSYSCFCLLDIGRPDRGSFSGTLLDNGKWELEMDVVFKGDSIEWSRSFSETFEKL
ncbi:MAG: hypothetical protein MRZ79_23170 [Bacteroidia bacterium]|nr:hypothetical protein [Bacteroidia bacterium]